MNYPLISEYIDAIKSAEDNFEELSHLRPVLDASGTPVMSSGNFAVVFKMKSETDGKLYAVKCFTKEQEGRSESYKLIAEELVFVTSDYIIPVKFYEKELYVDTTQTDATEFPVLLMDWVEGKTLDKYLNENINDKNSLEILAYKFSQLGSWLIPQPFAHGDLKPDNIIVRDNGCLVLVDYDGMFVPSMKGQKARELGSPDFRHPLRTENDFDEHIDDFSIASILLSLKAIAINPQLLEEYGATDRLLLSEKDAQDISQCRLFKEIFPSDNAELNHLIALFTIALTEKSISLNSFRLPIEVVIEILSTEVTIEDLKEAWIDRFKARYSKDKKRLLKGPYEHSTYSILKGTKVIGDSAFKRSEVINLYRTSHISRIKNLTQVDIPNSITQIGNSAFSGCKDLTQINIPNSVTHIGNSTFHGCKRLTQINIPNSVIRIGNEAFSNCENLALINIPNSVTEIGANPFKGNYKLNNIICQSSYYVFQDGALYTKDGKKLISCLSKVSTFNIPNSVTQIGNSAFSECINLTQINIPNSVTEIEDSAFSGCDNLTLISIPNSVTHIGNSAFSGCINLTQINIPNSVTHIGNSAFNGCYNLTDIIISNSATCIGEKTFENCKKLKQINIPNSVTCIGNSAFSGCNDLALINIANSVTHIGDSAFLKCGSLTQINIPNSITHIGNFAFNSCSNLTQINISNSVKQIRLSAFSGCINLSQINIPNSVTHIGDSAFSGCSNLTQVNIPNSVTHIGDSAFSGCSNLPQINIPNSVTHIGDSAFSGCSNLTQINIPNSVKLIGRNPFLGCYNLVKIICQSNYYTFQDGVLYTIGRRKLISYLSKAPVFKIPNSVTHIEDSAFSGCENLTYIKIPNSVIHIGDNAFLGNSKLTKIKISNSQKYFFKQLLVLCANLIQINIPNSVTHIGNSAFSGCKNLSQIIIPQGTPKKFKKLLPEEYHSKLYEQ